MRAQDRSSVSLKSLVQRFESARRLLPIVGTKCLGQPAVACPRNGVGYGGRSVGSSGAGAFSRRRSKARIGRLAVSTPLAVALLASAGVLAVATIGWLGSDHHGYAYFTRDPAAIQGIAPYAGLVSFFGLFGWSVAATALAFGGFSASLRGDRYRRTAQYVGAGTIGYLLLDDTFQLHENIYGRFHRLSDVITEMAYVALAVFLVLKGRRFIAATHYELLVTAGVFFGFSVALDTTVPGDRTIGFEDGAKLIGIFTLAAYCVDTALTEVRRLTSRAAGRQLVSRPVEEQRRP